MPGHVVWRGCNQPLLPGSPPVSVVQEQQGLADQENVVKVTDVACHILQCKVDKPFVSARVWVYEIMTDNCRAVGAMRPLRNQVDRASDRKSVV